MKQSPRQVFDNQTTLLPELTTAGYDHFKAASDLPAHIHAGTFEICYVEAGRVDWWVGDALYEVGGGELYVTCPDESHGGEHAVMNPCELYWFQVTPRSGCRLPGLTTAASRTLLEQLASLRPRSFLASPETADACRRLHAMHRGGNRNNLLDLISARGTLHTLLAGVVRDNETAHHAGRIYSPAVVAAIQFMQSHRAEPYRVEEVAEEVGINVGTLHSHFLAETGLTPGAWRMREMIADAKTMLAGHDYSITQIAFRLGLSSSQYFATAFHRVTGMTPGDYRERIQSRRSG